MTQLQRAFALLTSGKTANYDLIDACVLHYHGVIYDLRHKKGLDVQMERTVNPKVNLYHIPVPDGCYADIDNLRIVRY